MITDWNSPQGDFDPTEKQGELLMLLSGQQVTVHTSAEDDFDYMENEDVAFVVKNPHSEEDLLIELCGEFSVFFEISLINPTGNNRPTSLWRRAAGWSWCTGTRHRTGP